jgi:prepilin-type N-terminal cleavage/methylation domain-containing protein
MKKPKEKKNNQSGFTLVEMMVAVGLFTVVMVLGIGATLTVNNVYRQNRAMRSAIDNLSFIMEDIARNARLGFNYRCINNLNDLTSNFIETPQDGDNCIGVAFEPFYNPIIGDGTNQLVFLLDEPYKSIFRSDQIAQDIDEYLVMNSIDVEIDVSRSRFIVSGTGSGRQPTITIILNGTAYSGPRSTTFGLQTTVSQRLLNIPI